MPGTRVYSVKKPGALSKTRWMMRAIYSIKAWLFGRQLKLTSEIASKLFRMSVFVCRAHVKMWYTAPLAPQAPRNDLVALQLLFNNRELGTHWEAALEKFSKHLWYLSPTLVLLALLDNGVSVEEKRKIVASLQSKNGDLSVENLPVNVSLDGPVQELELQDFVSAESLQFFEINGLPSGFLGNRCKFS